MLPRLATIIARPQVKLDSSSAIVSIATRLRSNSWLVVGPPSVACDQRRISREQRRKKHHVRQDEQPEAVGHDDALRFRPAMAEAGVFRAAVGQADGGCFATWSCRLAQLVKVFHADAAPLAGVLPDLIDRDDMLMLVLPCIPDEDREGADEAEDRQPPDVPDNREAADRGEEGADYAGRRIIGISIGW